MQIISGGHPPNGGAYGIVSETTENRKIISEMKRMDNSFVDVTINYNTDKDSELVAKVKAVNELCKTNKVDCYSDIHFNASNGEGHGVECWILDYSTGLYASKESYNQNYAKAKKVCDSIANALGIQNRGIKLSKDFYVLKYPNCHSMIIEVCFLDNQSDMNKYNLQKVSKAIVEGLGGNVVADYKKEHVGRYINVKPFNKVFQVFKDDSSWELWNRQTLLGAEDGLSVKILDNLRKHVYKVSHPYGEGFVYISDLINNFTVTDSPAYRTTPPNPQPVEKLYDVYADGNKILISCLGKWIPNEIEKQLNTSVKEIKIIKVQG